MLRNDKIVSLWRLKEDSKCIFKRWWRWHQKHVSDKIRKGKISHLKTKLIRFPREVWKIQWKVFSAFHEHFFSCNLQMCFYHGAHFLQSSFACRDDKIDVFRLAFYDNLIIFKMWQTKINNDYTTYWSKLINYLVGLESAWLIEF